MWDPKQYHRFSDARMRPAYDLIERIPDNDYHSIVDLGCGSGEITHILKQKYHPNSIIGMDSSLAMIDSARKQYADIDWQINNIQDIYENYDLIFSNAALQWVDEHPALFSRLAKQANKTLAIQVPNNFHMPSHVLLQETIEENPNFYKQLSHTLRYEPVLKAEAYFDILKEHMKTIQIWETTYIQPLTGETPILEWVKGTALVPIKAALSPEVYQSFLALYQEKLAQAYPKRADGVTLFPFSRLFMIATA